MTNLREADPLSLTDFALSAIRAIEDSGEDPDLGSIADMLAVLERMIDRQGPEAALTIAQMRKERMTNG